MAEALAVVGVVATILQIVDYGTKIIGRLNEFKSHARELPKIYQDINTQLPLLINTLKRTKQQAVSGFVSDETTIALEPVLDACLEEVKKLKKVLFKSLPLKDPSNWQIQLHAIKTLAYEKDVKRSTAALEAYLRLLAFHQTTSTSDSSNKLLSFSASQPKSTLSLPKPQTPIFMVPFDQDESFVGRKDITDTIDIGLSGSQRRAVLAGMGGVGKSQIAIQYCHKHKLEHPQTHVFWVHCGTLARFDQGYKEIARRLKLPALQDPTEDIVKVVFNWLSEEDNGPWLLVLDNADDKDIFFGSAGQPQHLLQQQRGRLAQYLPSSTQGLILVTTRDRRVGERFARPSEPIIVPPLNALESAKMLLLRLPKDVEWEDTQALELVKNLENLPLAIAQAASYISEEDVSIARYIELLRPGNSNSKTLLDQDYYDPRRDQDIHNSLFRTWKISFDQVRNQVPRGAEILSLMAVLDKQSIPRSLLREDNENQVVFDKAIGTLKNFSLIQEEKKQNTYQIHRLVQVSTQWWLECEGTLGKLQESALNVLLEKCPLSVEMKDWKAWEVMSPHIDVVLAYGFHNRKQKLQYADVSSLAAGYRQATGRYSDAVKLEEDAFNIRRETLGMHDPSTLTSMSELVWHHFLLGEYPKAEEIGRENLRLLEMVVGFEDPATINARRHVGAILTGQGRYREAEDMLWLTLETGKRILAEDDSRISSITIDLANALSKMGRFRVAESLYHKAIAMRERTKGRYHMDTQKAIQNLATVFQKQGRLQEAQNLYEETLARTKSTLGEEHPVTLGHMGNLGTLLTLQERYEDAEILFRKTIEGMERSHGKEHHATARTTFNLGLCFLDQDKKIEAIDLFRRALDVRERVLGKKHLETIKNKKFLASTCENTEVENESEGAEGA